MNATVPLPQTFSDAIGRYPMAYALTVNADGTPHAVAITMRWNNGVLHLGELGQRTRENMERKPNISILWPATAVGGHAMMADGCVELQDGRATMIPTRAVLHRAGLPASQHATPSDCTSDCAVLKLP